VQSAVLGYFFQMKDDLELEQAAAYGIGVAAQRSVKNAFLPFLQPSKDYILQLIQRQNAF